MNTRNVRAWTSGAVASLVLMLPALAYAHCDTMDGPVIHAAKAALEQKQLTPVLQWVKPQAEAEVQAAFAQALTVRTQSPAAKDLADQYFFETVVRVHRAGEGAPYTGIKAAGTPVPKAIEEADRALETGSVEKALKLVENATAAGIRERFAAVLEKKKHAEHSVEAGREFVAAYVDYVHYVEGLYETAAARLAGPHQGAASELTSAHETHAGAKH